MSFKTRVAGRRANLRRQCVEGALAFFCVAMPGTARAQDSTVLVVPTPVPDYDRGRNVSVVDKPRPDYDPLGIRRGAFLIYPRLLIGVGVTDNVYLTDTNRIGDVYGIFGPSMNVTSDWSRHQLSLAGGATLRRYADQSPRNQDEWYVNGLGRVDIGSTFNVVAEGQAARVQESPFTGAIQSNVAALSSYQRRTAILRGQYVAGRIRATASYDYNHFEFDRIEFTDGTTLSQVDRDRGINRLTGQVEYALSPSLSVYGQLSYANTDYDRRLLTGAANRDSNAYRFIGGVNFDISAFIRGSIGVGYTQCDYNSGLYRDVGGLSAEARVEYFPTELTTVTLNLRRVLDDSSIGGTSAFFDNLVGVRVDHELLGNLLINASAAFSRQLYVDSPIRTDIYRFGGGARYLVSRSIQLTAQAGYGGRSQKDLQFGNVRELTAEIGIILQR